MPDEPNRDETDAPLPSSVKVAGITWIAIGCFSVLNAALTLALSAASAPGGVCPGLIGFLVGGVFIHAGLQTVRGTARDTLGNGVGSLFFGLLNLGVGLMLVGVGLAGQEQGSGIAVVAAVAGVVSVLAGISLLAAGVLALVGRSQYRAWLQAQKPPGPGTSGGSGPPRQ
jgi:hypothetical protein